ncbi:conserved domain protein [Paraprevotella xylaniphila YIT 11841]|uniref:Conserved domain protein n=1 Tax=Paraprevotella xylaniphila YIT 11841 TaxID=762982 RepID=F3QQW2_9BACT|nr:conserved domain protein [Paraprevotella xylaniphila YIT 11841]
MSPYLTLDIPDSFFEQNQGSHEDRGLHNLYTKEGYLSEEHRKEQLAFLNGRSPKDNPGVLPISK